MKIQILHIALIPILFFVQIKAFCQFNPESNAFISNTCKNNDQQIKKFDLKNIENLECKVNVFWGFNINYQLVQFSINGNNITSDGIIATSVPGRSLAVCNNLNGGSLSPTFYTSNINDTTIKYYDGDANWIAINQTPQHIPYNAGGFGNYLYFQQNGALPHYIEKYDGVSFSSIYYLDSLSFSVADIAVDDCGNIWCFTGISLSASQYIDVISPTGQLIKRYNFNINTDNAYGCFLLDGTLYLGLGSWHPIYPNTIVPIHFTPDSAYTNTPLSMPNGYEGDLASCNPGSPLLIKEQPKVSDFNLYPNPFSTSSQISFDKTYQSLDLSLFDLQGKIIQQKSYHDCNKITLDRAGIANGFYFLRVSLDGKFVETKKIVVTD